LRNVRTEWKSIDNPADGRHAPEYQPRDEAGGRRSPLQAVGSPADQSEEKEAECSEWVLDD